MICNINRETIRRRPEICNKHECEEIYYVFARETKTFSVLIHHL